MKGAVSNAKKAFEAAPNFILPLILHAFVASFAFFDEHAESRSALRPAISIVGLRSFVYQTSMPFAQLTMQNGFYICFFNLSKRSITLTSFGLL